MSSLNALILSHSSDKTAVNYVIDKWHSHWPRLGFFYKNALYKFTVII